MSIDIRTPEGGTSGGVELPAEIFDVQANIPLMHQVVVAQLAAARQGTHDTKTRGETRGGGRKPYRQKGTGRARQGSIRAPHYAGGGTAHGPTPRNYAQRTPKKMKAAALRGALSDRAREGRVHVVSGVVDGDQPSTRGAIALLAGSARPSTSWSSCSARTRSPPRACATSTGCTCSGRTSSTPTTCWSATTSCSPAVRSTSSSPRSARA